MTVADLTVDRVLRTDPQEVTEHIGPTSIVAHSQYWTFDHDENQDNICIVRQ